VLKPQPIEVALQDVTHAALYRHQSIDDNTAAWVCEFARRQIGKPYDNWGEHRASTQSGCANMMRGPVALYGSPLSLNPQKSIVILFDNLGQGDSRNDKEDHHDKSFFCSELIARCFEWAHIPVVNNIDKLPAHAISMRYLAHSKKLRFIDTLITQKNT